MNLNIKLIFMVFIAAKTIQQLLFNLYLLQLKEYRLDRFKEHIGRIYGLLPLALLRLTLFSPFSLKKLPRFTQKVVVLLIINLLFYVAVFFLFPPYISASMLLVTPFVLFVSLWIFFPFEFILRSLLYSFASRKILRLQNKSRLIVIGITGSYGKSTTKHFLNTILKTKFKVLKTPKSVNTPLAISTIVLKKLKNYHKVFIVEMGAYKRGEIKQLCNIVHPKYAIITGIGDQHIALFGSQDNIVSAKSELLQALPKDGIVIINKDSIQPVFEKGNYKKVIYFGNKTKVQELATTPSLSFIPNYLLNNLKAAVLTAKQFHVSSPIIKKALNSISLPQNTMNKKTGYKRAIIINDSYSANHEGALAAIDYLSLFPQKKKILILKPLIELGDKSGLVHKQIGEKAAEVASFIAVTDKQYYSSIKEGVDNICKVELITNTHSLIKILQEQLDKRTVVLIEGRVDKRIINFLTMKSS